MGPTAPRNTFDDAAYEALPALSAPLGLVAEPEEEMMYRNLTAHLMAAMAKACMTPWQKELVMDAFLMTSQALAADARIQHPELYRRPEPEPEPEPEPMVHFDLTCNACQRNLGPRTMPGELAEYVRSTFKCPGCLREGR